MSKNIEILCSWVQNYIYWNNYTFLLNPEILDNQKLVIWCLGGLCMWFFNLNFFPLLKRKKIFLMVYNMLNLVRSNNHGKKPKLVGNYPIIVDFSWATIMHQILKLHRREHGCSKYTTNEEKISSQTKNLLRQIHQENMNTILKHLIEEMIMTTWRKLISHQSWTLLIGSTTTLIDNLFQLLPFFLSTLHIYVALM